MLLDQESNTERCYSGKAHITTQSRVLIYEMPVNNCIDPALFPRPHSRLTTGALASVALAGAGAFEVNPTGHAGLYVQTIAC
jgi:hypothetical protein